MEKYRYSKERVGNWNRMREGRKKSNVENRKRNKR